MQQTILESTVMIRSTAWVPRTILRVLCTIKELHLRNMAHLPSKHLTPGNKSLSGKEMGSADLIWSKFVNSINVTVYHLKFYILLETRGGTFPC